MKNVEVIGNVFEVDPGFAGLQHINISDLSGSEDASIIVNNNTFTNGPAGVTITSWKVGETPWSEDLFTGTIEITGNTFNNVGLTSIENPLRNNVPIFISPEYVNDDATQGRVQDHGQFDADITVEDNTYNGELKLHIYDSEANMQDIFNAIPDGSTVILHGDIKGPVVNGDPYYTNALKIGSTITLTCEDDATLSGIVELNASMTLDHVNYYYKGHNTTYGNIWIGSDDVVIKNSVLFAEYDMNHSVAPNSDRDRSGEFGFIRPVNYNLLLLNNTIQTNAMGIFGGGLPGGIIKGNTFKSLDGYTSRTVWLNWADMNNLTIEGNTIYNRHMVLGGNATITGNKFLELGANGTSGHAFYFWSAFTGSISGNEYSQVDPTQPLATGQNGVIIPDID